MPHAPAAIQSARQAALRCLVTMCLHPDGSLHPDGRAQPRDTGDGYMGRGAARVIVAALHRAGLHGRVVRRCGWPDIATAGGAVPVMGMIHDGRWLLIIKAEAADPLVHVLNPADPRRGVLPLPVEAFRRDWGGTLVVVGGPARRAWLRPLARTGAAALAGAALAGAALLGAALLVAVPPRAGVPIAAVVAPPRLIQPPLIQPPPMPAPDPNRQAALRQRQDALRAAQARIEAELNDTPFDPPADTPAWTLQRTLHRQHLAQHAARLRTVANQAEAAQAILLMAEQGQSLLVQQLDLAREAEAMRAALYKAQSGSKLSLMDAQAARLHAEHDVQDARMQVHTAQQATQAVAAAAETYAATRRQDLLDALIRTRTAADALEQAEPALDGASSGS